MKSQHVAIITSPYTLSYVERNIPKPKVGNALVKILMTGICGSDLPRIAECDAKSRNLVIGHECVGVVESINCNCPMNDIHVGDRVVVVPILPCYECKWCLKGEYAHCERYSFMGSREDGALAEFMSVPLRNLIKIDDGITDEEAVFVEPLSVAIHALLQLRHVAGSFAVIIGAGAIGLLTLQVFRLYGVEKIAVFDIVYEKLEIARQMGADYTFNSNDESAVSEINKIIKDFDHSVVIESSDSSEGKCLAVDISLPKGEIVFIGSLSKPWSVSNSEFQKILRKELVLTGSWMNYSAPFPGQEWILALKLLRQNKVSIKNLVTYRSSLAKINEDVKILFNRKICNIKMMIHPVEEPL